MLRAAAVVATIAAATAIARAGGEVDLVSPRAIGHAGASLVSDDGAAAAFECPAALARRDVLRAQIAGLVIDDDVRLDSDGHPSIADRGPSAVAPLVGAAGGWERLVIAAAIARTESIDRRLPSPDPALPDATVIEDYPHRYADLEARWARTTLALAAALRVNDWLAIGATVTAARVDAHEVRRIWAGFAGRDGLGSPSRDVTVAIDASDALVAGGAIGALVAPAEVPIEIAIGAAWSDDARADGTAAIAAAHDLPAVELDSPTAHGRFGSALTLSAGVRWLGERWTAEADAAAWTYPTGGDAWQIDGARVIDDSGASAAIARMPTRLPSRSHGALRAAVDVAVLPGFLWLSAGYGWRGAGGSREGTTTAAIDAGGHTLAFGAEITAGRATISLGLARRLARTITVVAPGLPYDDPFPGGSEPVNLGRHTDHRDTVGIGLELAWP